MDLLGLAAEAGGQLLRDEHVGAVGDGQRAVDRVVVGDRHEVHPAPLGEGVDLLGRRGALGQAQRVLDPELGDRGGGRVAVQVDPAGRRVRIPHRTRSIGDICRDFVTVRRTRGGAGVNPGRVRALAGRCARAGGRGRPSTATFPGSSAHRAPLGSTPLPPRQRPTEPVGLYDPGYEHDACGVAFVARLSGEPSHETVQRAITALENLEHRGAAGADPNTGDGAGMLLQMPDELLRGLIGADLPPAGQYGVAVCFLPQEEERRHELERLLADTVEAEGQRVVTLARHPGREGLRRHHRQLVRAVHQAARRRGVARARRRPGRVRAQALRDPPRGRAGRRPGPRDPLVLEPHDRLQGHAHGAAAAGLLPRPAGRADEDRARARPLALLDEHVPELGARAPVPLHRPQRRDQHAARQRQLDARARVAARAPSCSAPTSRRCCRSSGPAARTRRRSTTCSSCSCSPAARSRTR